MSNDAWPTTRLSLLLRCSDPNANEAWSDFVLRYRPPIIQFLQDVFRLQPAEAEDVTQNVLLKLITAMRTFRYDSNRKFRAWLRTVTRNAVYDTLRAQKSRLDKASGDTRVKLMLDAQSSPADTLADAVATEIHEDLLQDAERLVQQRVEPHTWTAYLATKSGRAAREVGGELGMSTAAVYKAKSKVLNMIREELAIALGQQFE